MNTLEEAGIPFSRVRLLPVIERFETPEICPYFLGEENIPQHTLDTEKISVRLYVNVRGDMRLRRFLPLIAIGLLPQKYARRLPETSANFYDRYLAAYARLDVDEPEWSNKETPAERLARKLCECYSELKAIGQPKEQPSNSIMIWREGRWSAVPNKYIASSAEVEADEQTQNSAARDISEVFLTEALLSVASGDMLCGFEYILPTEPRNRFAEKNLNANANLKEVVRWIHDYPHRPLDRPDVEPANDEEMRLWTSFCKENPGKALPWEAADKLWTEEDPAILDLYDDLQALSSEGRSQPLSSEEMLALVEKRIPEYMPHYPVQIAVTGGINIEGILAGFIEKWIRQSSFLGVTSDEWAQFTLPEQMILLGMLMQRKYIINPLSLFRLSVRLFVHSEAQVWVESFALEPARLGEPLAQLNQSLALGGRSVLHTPGVTLQLPVDRTKSEEAPAMERKIRVISLLFLPVHLSPSLRCLWEVDHAALGKTCYLRQQKGNEEGHPPVSRLTYSPF